MPDLNLGVSTTVGGSGSTGAVTPTLPSPTSPVPSIQFPSNQIGNISRHRLNDSNTTSTSSSSNAGDLGSKSRIRGPLNLSPHSSEIDLNSSNNPSRFGTGSLDMPGILLSNADEEEKTVELSRGGRVGVGIGQEIGSATTTAGSSNPTARSRNYNDYPYSHSHTESYGMGGLPSQVEDSPNGSPSMPMGMMGPAGMSLNSLQNPSMATLDLNDPDSGSEGVVLRSHQAQMGYDRFDYPNRDRAEGSRQNTFNTTSSSSSAVPGPGLFRNGNAFGIQRTDSPVCWTDSPPELGEGLRTRNLDQAGRNLAFQDVDVEDAAEERRRQRGLVHRSSADFYTLAAGAGGVEGTEHVNFTDQGMEKAKSSFNKVGKSIKRISRRVVNLDGNENGNGLRNKAGHTRLPDADENDSDSYSSHSSDEVNDGFRPVSSSQPVQDWDPSNQLLRGKSLGFFGPTSKVRRALAKLMGYWWIEPLVLIMIVANVVILVIQSAQDVFEYPRKVGYFDYWPDYALLGIFVVFT